MRVCTLLLLPTYHYYYYQIDNNNEAYSASQSSLLVIHVVPNRTAAPANRVSLTPLFYPFYLPFGARCLAANAFILSILLYLKKQLATIGRLWH